MIATTKNISCFEVSGKDFSKIRSVLGGHFICVWPFKKAPEPLRSLSKGKGKEEWLAYVPDCLCLNDIPEWMREGTAFGVEDVEKHVLPDGSVIAIGVHY